MERCRLGWPEEEISKVLSRIGGFVIVVENMIHNINSHLWIEPSSKLVWSDGCKSWLPRRGQVTPVRVQEEVQHEAVDQPLIVVEQPDTVSQLLLYLFHVCFVTHNHVLFLCCEPISICSRFRRTAYCWWRIFAVAKLLDFIPETFNSE